LCILLLSSTSNKMNAPNKNGKANRAAPPPALSPEMPGLVQPYKDFVQRGWITLTVRFTAMETSIVVRVTETVDKEKSKIDISAAQAKQLIIEKGLWTPREKSKPSSKKDVESHRPSRSLTADDFNDGDEKVLARTLAIAKLQTDTVARGRIGSLKLMLDGADTFKNWWAVASSENKLRLFTDKKHLEGIAKPMQLRFGGIVKECPFRGPIPTPSEEE